MLKGPVIQSVGRFFGNLMAPGSILVFSDSLLRGEAQKIIWKPTLVALHLTCSLVQRRQKWEMGQGTELFAGYEAIQTTFFTIV